MARCSSATSGLGRHPADFGDHGPLRGRRGLFAGDDRLHLHGEGHELHVRDRPGRGEDRDQRDRHGGRAGRRLDPHAKSSVADGAFENDVEALLRDAPLFDFLPLSNREKPPVIADSTTTPTGSRSLDTLVPDNPNQPYDMKELILKVADEGDFFEIQEPFRQEHSHRLHPAQRLDGRRRRQPADGAGRRASTSTAEGGAVRALLRLPSTSRS
jgi:hypothetical protein